MIDWLAWEVIVGLAVGLLAGWLLEWLLDALLWRRRVRQVDAELARRGDQLAQLEGQNLQARLQLDGADHQVQELGVENETLRHYLGTAQTDFNRAREKLIEAARYISKMQNDRESLRRQLVTANVRLANVEAETGGAAEELGQWRTRYQAAESEMVDLRAILADRASTLSILSSQNRVLREQLEQVEQELNALRPPAPAIDLLEDSADA